MGPWTLQVVIRFVRERLETEKKTFNNKFFDIPFLIVSVITFYIIGQFTEPL